MRRGAVLGIGAVVVMASTALGLYAYSLQPAPAIGGRGFEQRVSPRPLPDLRFEDANGKARSLADFRGKLVLLNIWATWCPPCREEMPSLDRLQAQLGGPAFEVLALSIDQKGTDQVRKFFAEIDIRSLQIYIDPTAKAGFTLAAPGVPTTLLIDSAGREIGRHTGIAKWDAPDIVADLRRRMADTRAQ